MQAENDIPLAAKTSAYYDELWDEQTQTIEELTAPGSFGEARVHFIQESLQRIKSQTVQPLQILDLGCGSGWIETFLHPYGAVTAVDFSPRAIKRAQETYGQYAEFRLGEPTQVKLGLPKDQLFDVVVSSEVIEHVEDQTAFVQQISSFLKPHGWCVLTTPNGAIWDIHRQNEQYKSVLQPIENWLTPKQCAALFQQAGFKLLQHHGWSSSLYPYRPLSKLLTSPRGKRLFKMLGLTRLWKRIMLYNGILQLLLVRKQ
jgi:2-polyprenyl-3-methyl-5-hydroxy-6-metoxy-1,4-benzoquinol methylase